MSANSKKKDAEMAAYMKQHPNRFPDSVMRPHNGNGSDMRKMASQFGAVQSTGRHYNMGMLGGILCARLGMGSKNIPEELLHG